MRNLSLLACSILLSTHLAYADTNWTNYQGNAAHTGYVSVKTNPANIKQTWTQSLNVEVPNDTRKPSGYFLPHSLVVVDNTVYVTVSELFYANPHEDMLFPSSAVFALDMKTGQVKWERVLGDYQDAKAIVYDNGRVFVSIYDDKDETFHLTAYLADSGEEDYRVPFTDMYTVAANGNIYIKSKYLIGIDQRTGKLNWLRSIKENYNEAVMPAVSDQYIILNGINSIGISDAKTGRHLFEITSKHAYYDQIHEKRVVYDAARHAAYEGFRSDLPGSSYASLFAFDLTTKQVKWIADNDIAQPVLAGNDIFAFGYGPTDDSNMDQMLLQALDADTGKVKWTWQASKQDSYTRSDLVATDDVVFIPFKNSTIAVSRNTHQVAWQTDVTGSLALSGNSLIISRTNELTRSIELTNFSLN